jgi:hypothetical protein
MDWSGLLLLTLLGHETESHVTSVSGNVLDQKWLYNTDIHLLPEKNTNDNQLLHQKSAVLL